MSIAHDFATALRGIRPDIHPVELLPVHLAQAAVAVLPVSGAGISVFTDDAFRVPVGASDQRAADAERLQFTLAEGPCIEAHRSGRPVVATESELASRWPLFHEQLVAKTPFRSVTAVPLKESLAGVGTLDLFWPSAADPTRVSVGDVDSIATEITRELLSDKIIPDPDLGPSWLGSPHATPRSWVLVAMGMMNVSLAITAEDALALLRSYAYSVDRTVDDVADDLVTRKLTMNQLSAGA